MSEQTKFKWKGLPAKPTRIFGFEWAFISASYVWGGSSVRRPAPEALNKTHFSARTTQTPKTTREAALFVRLPHLTPKWPSVKPPRPWLWNRFCTECQSLPYRRPGGLPQSKRKWTLLLASPSQVASESKLLTPRPKSKFFPGQCQLLRTVCFNLGRSGREPAGNYHPGLEVRLWLLPTSISFAQTQLFAVKELQICRLKN